MKSKLPVKKISILNFWLSAITMLFGFALSMVGEEKIGFHIALFRSLVGFIIFLFISFSNLGLLIIFEKKYKLNNLKSKLLFLSLSHFCSISIFFVVIYLDVKIINTPVDISRLIYVIIIGIIVNNLNLLLQNYVIIQEGKAKADLENSRLKTANANASNQLLRQQIHPHFLFNTLSVLKSLYRVNQKAAEEYLIHLSDFLRVSISSNNIKIIPLKEELKLCNDYIEMQKIRFGDSLVCTVSIPDSVIETGFVPSFSIQPLLENAIKHNELTEESPLYININQEGTRIIVSNNIKLKSTNEITTGSGLSNLSERYKILAEDEIIISDNKETFSVSIKILSDEK